MNQHAEFDLRIFKTYDPYSPTSNITLDYFQLKSYPPHNAHLLIVKEIHALQEIELHIEMKIYTNNMLNSISIMKILVYISQYDFYP